jgi:hypothetical protein
MPRKAGKAATGRPSQLKDPVRSKILASIRLGLPYYQAARAGGIAPSTFWAWMAAGRKDAVAKKVSPFSEFLDAVKKAEAEHVREAVGVIRKIGKKQWQAMAWILERRHPKDFGNDRTELRRALKEMAEMKELVKNLHALLPKPATPNTEG